MPCDECTTHSFPVGHLDLLVEGIANGGHTTGPEQLRKEDQVSNHYPVEIEIARSNPVDKW